MRELDANTQYEHSSWDNGIPKYDRRGRPIMRAIPETVKDLGPAKVEEDLFRSRVRISLEDDE